ncbi:hypothetical protein [Aquibacillus rhizosphaerae]|uniref:Uncharacterized protein n=1 Tax=Aquibacillus rhizosphaerae TaxID=3051431 RepID=A0ABT7L255_9BACI|nr:hypothetical protein [Aquibacillus sp. LR5S19]MDL4839934.1 hypothetical protein [Aquibacillus sp. LR5S19]
MLKNHGVGYAEYSRKLNERLKIEKEREISHKESQKVVNEVEKLVHR